MNTARYERHSRHHATSHSFHDAVSAGDRRAMTCAAVQEPSAITTAGNQAQANAAAQASVGCVDIHHSARPALSPTVTTTVTRSIHATRLMSLCSLA